MVGDSLLYFQLIVTGCKPLGLAQNHCIDSICHPERSEGSAVASRCNSIGQNKPASI
jgi:hypothetical protein